MQTDEDFNIKFVNIVKRHKCLYDKKVPEYRNKDEQEKSWMEIAQETRESVSHCKERWRNLRACLSRYIKQQSSSDPQHKPYYLSEHMHFLLPFLKSHRQMSMGGDGYTSYEMPSDMSLDIKHSDPEDTMEFPDHNKFSTSSIKQHRLSDTETTSVNCVPDVHVEIDSQEANPDMVYMTSTERIQSDKKRLKLEGSCYADNSDMDFFRSILPDIQGMNAQQKRKFKIGILELIDDIFTKYPEKRILLPPPPAQTPESNGCGWRRP